MKRCSKCHQLKPYKEFYRNMRRPDGYQSVCKTCSSKYNKEGWARMHGYGNWDPFKYIDDRRWDVNMNSISTFNKIGRYNISI